MKKIYSILPAALLTLSAHIFAAPEVSMKFAMIDTQVVMNQVNEGQKAIETIKAESATLSAAEQKAKIEIEAKVAKYQAGASKLSETARQQEEQKLTQEFSQVQQSLVTKGEELKRKAEEVNAGIRSKVTHIAESVAKKNALDLVVEKAVVVYSASTVPDLTSEVVAAYNKAFPVVEPKKAAPAAKPKVEPKKTAPAKPKVEPAPAVKPVVEPAKAAPAA